MAFILQEPLLAITGTTPNNDNPLLDNQEVTQNCKSLHQHNTIPRCPTGMSFMLLAVLMFLPSLKVALEARDSKSPSGTTHAPSALEENHLGSQTSQLP